MITMHNLETTIRNSMRELGQSLPLSLDYPAVLRAIVLPVIPVCNGSMPPPYNLVMAWADDDFVVENLPYDVLLRHLLEFAEDEYEDILCEFNERINDNIGSE
jgi:hypothetical protein